MERYRFNPEKAGKSPTNLLGYLDWFRREDADIFQVFYRIPPYNRDLLQVRVCRRDGTCYGDIFVSREFFDRVPDKPFKAEDWL